MAWFKYDYSYPGGKRHHRKGVFLRVSALTTDILNKIEASKNRRPLETIDLVKVENLLDNNYVLLQIWCVLPGESLKRHNVFYIIVKEDPEWICEQDIGRGYVIPKSK